MIADKKKQENKMFSVMKGTFEVNNQDLVLVDASNLLIIGLSMVRLSQKTEHFLWWFVYFS